jgi:uroporphyrinogen-III synthase
MNSTAGMAQAMTETPLTGFTVAVTRPARQNDALVQQLRALGATVIAIPLLAIEPLREPAQRQKIDTQLHDLPNCHMAIFISQNAAEQVLQALAERNLTWPSHIQAFAIGSATTAFLSEHGITAISPLQMNSEGLLALPVLQNINKQRCIIFRGLGGRETLAQTLRERGAVVDYCELYRRELPAEAKQQWAKWMDKLQNQPALVCVNSVETLQHLQTADQRAISRDNLGLLVPGERVARAATAAGFTRIVTANDATDNAMLESIIHTVQSIHIASSIGIHHD